MNNENFKTFFDCGSSKLRAGTFNKADQNEAFYSESNFFTDHSNFFLEAQKIVKYFEKHTNEYIKNIDLMLDSAKMLSIGISISKKINGSKLKQENVQFLVQEAKQQILKYYKDHQAVHIVLDNYKIDNIDYSYLPNEIKCKLISLDIVFICIPNDIITYFKKEFSKLNIIIDQIICSSYAKSMNYKNNFQFEDSISFIDMGFNKTSITCFNKNKIFFSEILPIGGNHITKDISKILKVSFYDAENLKLSFDKDQEYLVKRNISPELIQSIIFARIEEILELCAQSIKSNLNTLDQCKMVLMGEGSKILNNKFKEKISFSRDIDLLEESSEDVCNSAFKASEVLDSREVVVVPKKSIKRGFFEKFFHIFS